MVNLSGLFAPLSDGIGEFLLPMINLCRGERNVIGEKRTMTTALLLLVGCAYLLIRRQKGADGLCMFLEQNKSYILVNGSNRLIFEF